MAKRFDIKVYAAHREFRLPSGRHPYKHAWLVRNNKHWLISVACDLLRVSTSGFSPESDSLQQQQAGQNPSYYGNKQTQYRVSTARQCNQTDALPLQAEITPIRSTRVIAPCS